MTLKTRIFQIVRYIAVNSGFAWCIYSGLVLQNSGAENLFKFLTWVFFAGSLLFLIPPIIDAIAKSENTLDRAVPVLIDIIYDVSVTLALAYLGSIFYASLYMIRAVILHTMISVCVKLREKYIMEALSE